MNLSFLFRRVIIKKKWWMDALTQYALKTFGLKGVFIDVIDVRRDLNFEKGRKPAWRQHAVKE
jgi:hypothetical protein